MTTLRTDPTVVPDSPPATRARSTTWRDPRLVAGVVLVAGCVLLGARVLAAADDTVAVWTVRHDVAAGSVLRPDDLAVARVHFDGAGGDGYAVATADLPPGSVAAHDLAAGELLPRSAVAARGGESLVEVPLSVAPDDIPAGVGRGSTVDVWVTPEAGGTGRPRARLALDDAVVVAVPETGDSLAPQSTQQVVVGVDQVAAATLADALGLLADGRVVITRRAGDE